MSLWEAFDLTVCERCGIYGGGAGHSGICNLCKVEIEDGLVWPWLMTQEAMDAILLVLERIDGKRDQKVPDVQPPAGAEPGKLH